MKTKRKTRKSPLYNKVRKKRSKNKRIKRQKYKKKTTRKTKLAGGADRKEFKNQYQAELAAHITTGQAQQGSQAKMRALLERDARPEQALQRRSKMTDVLGSDDFQFGDRGTRAGFPLQAASPALQAASPALQVASPALAKMRGSREGQRVAKDTKRERQQLWAFNNRMAKEKGGGFINEGELRELNSQQIVAMILKYQGNGTRDQIRKAGKLRDTRPVVKLPTIAPSRGKPQPRRARPHGGVGRAPMSATQPADDHAWVVPLATTQHVPSYNRNPILQQGRFTYDSESGGGALSMGRGAVGEHSSGTGSQGQARGGRRSIPE
jgi:hypothetical protein